MNILISRKVSIHEAVVGLHDMAFTSCIDIHSVYCYTWAVRISRVLTVCSFGRRGSTSLISHQPAPQHQSFAVPSCDAVSSTADSFGCGATLHTAALWPRSVARTEASTRSQTSAVPSSLPLTT
jgi:hypothetical protein